jgi:hypothetical protein
MAYSLKKRKQLSKSSKKNKTKLRKAKKTNRTRRFRKQYGGDLSKPQKKYIEKEIKDLGFTEVQKGAIFKLFDAISSHVSKTLKLGNKSSTVLKEFFKNVNSNYERYDNLTVEDKQDILLGGLFRLYHGHKDEDPVTDKEDDD